MKLLIVKNWNEHSGCDWDETEVVCASEDESRLDEVLLQLCKECLDSDKLFWRNEEFDIELQKNSNFYIVDLKVI